ncbi:unnamed protein product [Blepharisma stoltei]|uniref:Methyltransferase type 11 domain-containing protein n=1 Tax=Blepharisma stoltei TaxID=1481888 RepID=A0AAU9KN20_9CILI|nr:unnamed protein product [Blepharisma stoltei]
MSGVKYIVACGLVLASSQFYHSYRQAKESELKELYRETLDKANLLKQIHNKIAPKWDYEQNSYEWAKRIDKYRKILCSYAEGKVLEVGVGTGSNFEYYPRGVRVIGVDWSPDMLKECNSKPKGKLKNVTLAEMDAKSLSFSDELFDTVVATFVLSSTDNPSAVIKEMIRVCKPNGTILILDRGKGEGVLTNIHLSLYRYKNLFKFGYDQCTNIKKIIDAAPVKIEIEERKQGGHIYFYLLKKIT